jgi:oligopeptide transport system permease protein
MLSYTIRRLLSAVPTLLILVTLTFFLLRLAPGGPFDGEQVWPPEIQANIAHQYGLDEPLTTQYFHWMKGALQGDFKESFQYLGRPVSEIIAESLPVSALLGFWAILLAIIFGMLLGCLSAWKARSWLDRMITAVTTSGVSLPNYLVATVLILVFSLQLGWLPPALWESPSSLILPIITLSWRPMSLIARLVRTSMDDSLSADYIRTARGKGLPEGAVIYKHALKNSLVPVASILGPTAANLITGSFLVEIVFQLPGMGKHFVQAVLNRDYPLVMGVTLTYGIVLIISNLLSDILAGWIDPRIRLEEL